jgi:hypothetical protein
MEIVTEELEPSALASEFLYVLRWLDRHSVVELGVSFGVGCALSPERLWKPLPVQTCDLPEFVQQAIATGTFTFGKADLHLDAWDVAFTFCHESDLHFRSEDPTLIEDVRREWTERGYSGYQSATDSLNREWVPFGR